MKSPPLVSIVIPAYNAAPFMTECLESALRQTYSNFEIIVINDGSTDSTKQKVRAFKDQRIRLINNSVNMGLVSVRNLALKEAKGEFLAWLDADDIVSSAQRVELQVRHMQNNTKTGICGSWFKAFGSVDFIAKFPEYSPQVKAGMLFDNCFGTSTVMIRMSLVRKYQLAFTQDYSHTEDYDFWRQVLDVSEGHNIQKVLCHYRVHDSQITNKDSSRRIRRSIQWDIQKRLLEKLDVNASEDEKQIHLKIGIRRQFATSLKESSEVQSWLNKLREKNNLIGVYDSVALENVLSRVWFDFCYLSLRKGTDLSCGVLSFSSTIPLVDRLKYFVFSLRLKYLNDPS